MHNKIKFSQSTQSNGVIKRTAKLASNPKSSARPTAGWLQITLKLALFALCYLAAAWVSQRLTMEPERIAVIWLPTGLAVAALLLSLQREWAGYLVIAFAANVTIYLANGQAPEARRFSSTVKPIRRISSSSVCSYPWSLRAVMALLVVGI